MRKEQIHYEAVIAADNQPEPTDYCISAQADHWNGFVEGFEAGAKWADENPEWIPVDKEMPPRHEKNNRYSIYVQVIDIYGWQETDWYDFEEKDWKISDANYVTHWKYLSPPPEGIKLKLQKEYKDEGKGIN